jgi:hypothetical protein
MHGLVENGYIARRSGEDSTLGFINGKSAPSCGPGAQWPCVKFRHAGVNASLGGRLSG